jgi:chromosome segregation ATPase
MYFCSDSDKNGPEDSTDKLTESEELAKLRRENQELRDRIHGINNLKSELSDLRLKLADYERTNRDPKQDHSKDSKYKQLLDENKSLMRSLEDMRIRSKQMQDGLVGETHKLKEMLDKDRKMLLMVDKEANRLNVENQELKKHIENSAHENRINMDRLESKLRKREVNKGELEKVLNELQMYKKEKEDEQYTRDKKLEDVTGQNKYLREEITQISKELGELRKMYLNEKKRLPSPNKAQSHSKDPKRCGRTPETKEAVNFQPLNQGLVLDKFLLGLEVYRLNFAYLNCRCGKMGDTDPQPSSNYLKGRNQRVLMESQTEDSLMVSHLASDTGQNESLANIISERDNLKQLLAEYQKKMLTMKREKDQHTNVEKPVKEAKGVEGGGVGTGSREQELRIKVLVAENSKLNRELDAARREIDSFRHS